MATLSEKYKAVNEGRLAKSEFLRQIRQQFPLHINQYNSYPDAIQILKTRGLLYEATAEEQKIIPITDTFPLEAIERGIDFELEKMGLDSVNIPSKEEYKRARAKAVENLAKDSLYYLGKLMEKPKKEDTQKPKKAASGMTQIKPAKSLQEVIEKKENSEEVLVEFLKKKIRNLLKEELEFGQEGQPEEREVNLLDKINLVSYICFKFGAGGVQQLLSYANIPSEGLSEGEKMKKIASDYLGINSPASILKAIGRYEGNRKYLSASQVEFLHTAPKDMEEALQVVKKVFPNPEEFVINKEKVKGKEGESEVDVKSVPSNLSQEQKAKLRAAKRTAAIQAKIREIASGSGSIGKDKDMIMFLVKRDLPWATDVEIRKLLWKDRKYEGKVEEGNLLEAATTNLSGFSDEHASVDSMPSIINSLENVVTEMESFITKMHSKVQAAFDRLGQIKNDEGISIGAKYATKILESFKLDMDPVLQKICFDNYELPQLPTIDDAVELSPEEEDMQDRKKRIVYAPAGLDETVRKRKYTGR